MAIGGIADGPNRGRRGARGLPGADGDDGSDASGGNGSVAATLVSEDATHRFATDAEKATWNAKQDALGFTPYDAANPAGYTANDTDAALRDRATHTGTQSADTLTDGTTNKAFLATERTKLAGIATSATANSSDATLLDRANHTGTQLAASISNFAATVLATVLAGLSLATSTAVTAADSLLVAIGKLQAQVTLRALAATTISTTAPLAGGGSLAANRTLTIAAATTALPGSMSAADKAKLDLVISGVYTPTGTALSNVSALTTYPCQWSRNGATVTVSGKVDATITAATTASSLALTLPVASNLANAYECGGTCGSVVGAAGGGIYGDPATDRAVLGFLSGGTGGDALYFSFTYRII